MHAPTHLRQPLSEHPTATITGDVRRDWDTLRATAISPQDIAEIDAIFGRQA